MSQGGGQEYSTISGSTLPLQSIGAQVGRVLGGRYQLDKVIGSGGMGEIYRARRLHIGDTVAVKVLRPDVVENEKSRQRFYREARAAAMLHHPNAVVIHDFGEDTDGTAYIVMELLLGRSLRQVLIDDGTVSAPRCYGIIRQACAALDAGHRNGIIHRDIKPDNIILLDSNDGADHVKILDFGIAKLRDQALDTLSMEQRLTNVGTVIGTPHYMAPEQCQGEEADARSDIYSLGVVLYELLTGVAPFLAKTPTGVAIKHVTEKPRPLRELQPGISENVEGVVLRALEKDPNARQQTALELAREFEAAVRADGSPDMFIRSGEQQIDPDTMRLAKGTRTEGISSSPATSANPAAPAGPPQSFDTTVSPQPATEKLKDASTGMVSPSKQTMEQKATPDNLKTQVIVPTEPLAPAQSAPPPPAAETPAPAPPPAEPAKAEPVKAEAKPAAKAPEPKARDAKPAAKAEKSAPAKESPKPAAPVPAKPAPAKPAEAAAAASAPAKSKLPLLAGVGAGVVILAAAGWWAMSGKPSQTATSGGDAPAPSASVASAASPAAASAYPEHAAPEGMVYVLGGAFRVGRDDGDSNERPAHTVTVKPFFMDRTEVTNEQYQKYLDATNRPAPPTWKGTHFPEGTEKLPVTDVSWEEATAYAEWAGKRLPTEEEWEFAARGADNRVYPWGDDWKPDTANVKSSEDEKRELLPVGQYALGASPFGIVDMIGNAWEWTSSGYKEYPGGAVEAPPKGFKVEDLKVIRGGSYESIAKKATATRRFGWPGSRSSWPKGSPPDYKQTGFRCVQDAK